MSVSLNKPAIGSTSWGSEVNQNWTDIEDAFNEPTWGPTFPLVKPDSSQFSWYNQGGSSMGDIHRGFYLKGAAAASFNLRCLEKATPSTPYTITLGFLLLFYPTNFSYGGFFWRDNGGTPKLVIVTVGYSNGFSLWSGKYNSVTSWNSTYLSIPWAFPCSLVWLRCADDGTNRKVSISSDGQNFMEIHSVSRTDFLTPTNLGIFCDNTNSKSPVLSLLHWEES